MADDTRQTLDIPNGTTFEFQDGKLVFGHESDIVIRTNLGGYKFRKIFSKNGSVHVIPPEGVEFEVDEIEARQGEITLSGAVRVHETRARTVHFNEGRLTADRIEAESEVVLSGRDLEVLHVKAPKVTVEPDCRGTVLVVESDNDPGSFRARGGFRSLEEATSAFERFGHLTGGGKPSATSGQSSQEAEPEAAPAPAEQEAGDTAEVEAEEAPRSATTQEFRPAQPSKPPGGPSLPKSSVFRKRK
jgi:hypothetical protein